MDMKTPIILKAKKKKKAPKGLMADQSQQTETQGKLQSKDAGHTGHTKNEQQRSEEQDASRRESAKGKEAQHRRAYRSDSSLSHGRSSPHASSLNHPTSAGLATASQTKEP